jgi:hypothetical protein
MHMKIKDLPEEFITLYNLTNKATSNGFVYIKIKRNVRPPTGGYTRARSPGATSK